MILDPTWLARLAPLELRARVRTEGAAAGRHAGLRRGLSGEFIGQRPYAVGDEWRRIDWKAYARTDRWTVREARMESPLSSTLFLDVSRSMAFSAEGRLPKIRYAALLLSLLAAVLVRRQEGCGLGLVNDHVVKHVPSRTGAEALARLMSVLEGASAAGATDIGRALDEARPALARRGVVVVASDFLQPLEGWLPSFRRLSAAGHDVIAFQVLDPVELSLAISGSRRFEDLETGGGMTADPEIVGARYRALMAERQRRLTRSLTGMGVEPALFETDEPIDVALALFLRRRMERL